MAGLVEQLQTDALNPKVPVDTLLRKVKVAATRLGLDDALLWVESELTGYRDVEADDVPDYRKGQGQTLAWNPYHGWQPIEFGDGRMADIVSSVLLLEPIGNYEKLIENGSTSLHLPVPNLLVAELNKLLNVPVPRIVRAISQGMITQVVQRVRDLVLDWALELSRAGITGEGLMFSEHERQKAAASSIHIGTFNGSFSTGDAIGEGSQISVSSRVTSYNNLFEEINEAVRLKVDNHHDKEAIIFASSELSKASGRENVLSAYNRLLEAAANHMTVLAPFLPALGAMIASS